MTGLYYLNVTVHVLAAFLWLGGMFFLAVAGAPVLRKVESPELRSALFRELGERFRTVGWISIGVLVLTGTLNLFFRGVLDLELLSDPAFWRTRYGTALAWKLLAVLLMLGNSALHDFVIGPRAAREAPGSARALASRRTAALMARGNAIVGIILVAAAVRLARGG